MIGETVIVEGLMREQQDDRVTTALRSAQTVGYDVGFADGYRRGARIGAIAGAVVAALITSTLFWAFVRLGALLAGSR